MIFTENNSGNNLIKVNNSKHRKLGIIESNIIFTIKMSILGNIIWLIFGGLITAIEYFISSVLLMITIIGIPFGFQTLKLGIVALWPFGTEVKSIHTATSGCLNTIMNIIWILIGGIWIFLTHLVFGIFLMITIIGIPFGMQHFKLAKLALTPFGYEVF
jgi:uncharacterized membrane protein YccF (DUF307 family)